MQNQNRPIFPKRNIKFPGPLGKNRGGDNTSFSFILLKRLPIHQALQKIYQSSFEPIAGVEETDTTSLRVLLYPGPFKWVWTGDILWSEVGKEHHFRRKSKVLKRKIWCNYTIRHPNMDGGSNLSITMLGFQPWDIITCNMSCIIIRPIQSWLSCQSFLDLFTPSNHYGTREGSWKVW